MSAVANRPQVSGRVVTPPYLPNQVIAVAAFQPHPSAAKHGLVLATLKGLAMTMNGWPPAYCCFRPNRRSR
jgi:hypothetical protein